MIQINERGRQGQLRAKYMRDIRNQAKREDILDGEDDEKEVNRAALKIQSVYRGFVARKRYRKMMYEEVIFLGMEAPPVDPQKISSIQKSEATRDRRRQLRKQHEEEYAQALISTKEKILKVEGPDMKESIQDSFRQWYMEYKRINGKLPDFPDDEVWKQNDFQFAIQQPNTAANDGSAASAPPAKGEEAVTVPAKKDDKKGKKGETETTEESFKYDNSEFLTMVKTQ